MSEKWRFSSIARMHNRPVQSLSSKTAPLPCPHLSLEIVGYHRAPRALGGHTTALRLRCCACYRRYRVRPTTARRLIARITNPHEWTGLRHA